MSSKRFSCVLALGVVLAVPGFANIVTASGAGSLPATAENLSADTDLTGINGTLPDVTGNEVAVFKIDIVSPTTFSAETVSAGPFGIPDTVLMLFDLNGNGVYLNDDKSGLDTLSCLPAFDPAFTPSDCSESSSGSLGPTSSGTYFLAITRSSNYPLDGLNNEIFSPSLFTDVVGPNSGVGAVAGWDGFGIPSANTDLVNYSIAISEAPEPVAWPVISALCLGLMLFRRRLRTH